MGAVVHRLATMATGREPSTKRQVEVLLRAGIQRSFHPFKRPRTRRGRVLRFVGADFVPVGDRRFACHPGGWDRTGGGMGLWYRPSRYTANKSLVL